MYPRLKVKDMQGDNVRLIQSESDVKYFNGYFNQDFSFYFLKNLDPNTVEVYGSNNVFLNSNVYYLGTE